MRDMQDRFERLDEVDELLRQGMVWIDTRLPAAHVSKLRDARQTLQLTITQLRADYGAMAEARRRAVDLLTELQEQCTTPYYRVAAVIAALQGREGEDSAATMAEE